MSNNTSQSNHNISDMERYKMEVSKIYEDCELTGIKINTSEKDIKEKFGKEILDIFLEYPDVLEKDGIGLKNKKEVAENYLHNIVKIDAIQYEINQKLGGAIDTKKTLDFDLFMTDKTGKEHTVKFENFQLGINDTTKGFQHLLMQAKSIDDKKSVIKSISKLDDICKVPSQLTIAKISSKSHDIVKSLSNTIPQEISPELSAFLKHFVDKFLDSDKQRDRKKFIAELEKSENQKEAASQKNMNENNKQESIEKTRSINNPNAQIITADIEQIEVKKYENGKEPDHIKNLKSDTKKLQEYEKRYDEIFRSDRNLTTNDKKELANKLEKEFGVSIGEYLGIKEARDELRKQAINQAQSQKKSLNDPAQAISYDEFYLNSPNPNSKIGNEAHFKAKFYKDGTEPDYIKDFKSNANQIADYQKEFESIYKPDGKLQDGISEKELQNKVNNLERTYKISIPEFLGIKNEQIEKRIEATKHIKDNDLAKTAKPKEQIRTNQPTDRSL